MKKKGNGSRFLMTRTALKGLFDEVDVMSCARATKVRVVHRFILISSKIFLAIDTFRYQVEGRHRLTPILNRRFEYIKTVENSFLKLFSKRPLTSGGKL